MTQQEWQAFGVRLQENPRDIIGFTTIDDDEVYEVDPGADTVKLEHEGAYVIHPAVEGVDFLPASSITSVLMG